MSDAKIAFIDIETAPIDGFTWQMHEANVVSVKFPSYILCFSVKWADHKRISTYALPDYPNFAKDKRDDSKLAIALRNTLDTADIAIAHNGDSFDFKKIAARLIVHDIPPPSPFKTIDTLKAARKYFRVDSNRLNDIGGYLKVGEKLPHTGMHLWRGCMDGDPDAWRVMKKYNARDVDLLEKVYLRLRPWIANHPNLNVFSGKATIACPSCQS